LENKQKQIDDLIKLVGPENSNFIIEQLKLMQSENDKLRKEVTDFKKDSKLGGLENVAKSETKLESSSQGKIDDIKIKITIDARSEVKEKNVKNLQIEMKNDHKIKNFSKNKQNTKNSVKKPKINKKEKNDSDYDVELDIEDNDISIDSLVYVSKSNKNLSDEDKSSVGSALQEKAKGEDYDSIVDKTKIGIDKSIKWSLVTDHENFNKYLKLDDEHYSMPSSRSQDKFKDSNPFEIFSAFLTDELLQHIVDATNEHLEDYKSQSAFLLMKLPQHRKNYDNLTLNEMKVFIAIKIYINFFRCHRKCGKRLIIKFLIYLEYWMSNNVFKGAYIKHFMAFNRFEKLNANIKISKKSEKNATDKLSDIRFYLDYLLNKWQENYYPGRDLTIDETMIAYSGNKVKFNVILRNKPINEGFLFYDLADPKNGYLLNGEIYTGNDHKKSSNSVMKRTIRIIKKYLDKGHIFYGDNFYTSLELVQYLTSRNTGYVGTLRNNRDKEKDLDKGMKKDDLRYFTNENYPYALLTVWYDSIIVKMLSNCKQTKNVMYKVMQIRKFKVAPLVFRDYNKKAGGVDLANHRVSMFKTRLHEAYWWGSIFNHFLLVTITNAYIIYRDHKLKEIDFLMKDLINPERKARRIMNRKQFSLSIVRQLLVSNGEITKAKLSYHFKDENLVLRNVVLESDTIFPHIPSSLNKRFYQDRKENFYTNYECIVCKELTEFYCEDCAYDFTRHPSLCMQCFETFHRGLFSLSDKQRISYYNKHFNK